MSVWVVVDSFQGLVNEVQVFDDMENANKTAAGLFSEHVAGDTEAHRTEDCRTGALGFGSCSCGEYDILVVMCELHDKAL